MTAAPARLAQLEPARICIIKPSSLGDVVHALPILAALRARWPSAHLAWVVDRAFHGLLEGHPSIDELIVYDRSPRAGDFLGLKAAAALYQRLAQGRFDLTIDLQGLLRSALMTAATRAPVRLGMADAREGARWLYTDTVDASRLRVHAVERTMRVAAALGASAAEPRFDLPITANDTRWARETLLRAPAPRVVLNLGARWLTKRWPPEHFAEIARRAVASYGAGVVAVGSPGDRPLVQSLMQETLSASKSSTSAGAPPCTNWRHWPSKSDVLISNDTGPLHVAAAAGARVVGIYTCTDPRLTGPFGPRATTVQTNIWCKCSLIRTCDRMECMSELTPDRVWPVVERQLELAIAAA